MSVPSLTRPRHSVADLLGEEHLSTSVCLVGIGAEIQLAGVNILDNPGIEEAGP
jgi:hypothetical protein